ncbi:MAG TPA: sigma-54 dependent transcriptional regulator [Gemmatimonadaceae bacterium]|nr:sigma-54 dependent transcriptional regulator [Gemmatimonadaceae bacterium]
MSLSVLVVDDDATVRETLADFFDALGYTVRVAGAATEARRALAAHAPDVALLDLHLPDAHGLRLLEAVRADDPEAAVIILTGHADVPTAVQAMKQGAVDFLEKPVDLEALQAAVERAAETVRLRREVAVLRARTGDGDVGDASAPLTPPTTERVIELAARNDEAPVLIVGETGTGKGYVARRIHEASARRAAPFVEINCASLSATFFESELFGHEKGAFTDAKQAKRGLLEVAAAGSVFLDEVTEMTLDVQPKLLKAIEERTFRRLGGTAELRSAARVIAATNAPVDEAVRRKRFRADLYYRLQVLTIALPPLRERAEQIPALARALLPRGATLGTGALRALAAYHWPGNIRELKNALWRAAILAEGRPIGTEHLGLPGSDSPAAVSRDPDGVLTIEEAERRAIVRALEHTRGNKARAAQMLGIARSTLNEKVRRLEGTD